MKQLKGLERRVTVDNIIKSPIVEEVEQSFLDYSLSVITDRAIPAVEDGLKPVMRRILWCMQESGYKSDKQYVKCARPVGDTIGKYHPHGDSSIYGALIGASQPWNMRYPLIDFHGNNGSRDGDPPAAMRYTECKLSKISEATLDGIKKDTVDWMPNFDETLEEPVYLPGLFPNLLCNGTTGIAVAMACNFAPHNLGSVMDAITAYIRGDALDNEKLSAIIQAPDFPTGGQIINGRELSSIYKTGKGRVKIRGTYVVERTRDGRDRLVFTTIPYKISKEELAREIDELCEAKKLDGIGEILDESNREGVRFVVELAKGFNADVIANKLYELTDLETSFSVNMVALVNKVPKQLTLKDIIENYVKHQEDVFRRANEYDLKKLEKRIHILEGLCMALDDIDNVIKLIKASRNKAEAHVQLKKKYYFSDEQATAILDMTLSRLANMEKLAIEQEKKDKETERAIILKRLNDEEVFKTDLIKVLEDFKAHFTDARRTEITHIEVTKEEKEIAQIVPEDVVVVVTEAGNVKRVPKKNFKIQKRNGKGVKTQDDITLATIETNTVDVLLAFTNKGKVYRIGADTIPEGTQATRGVALSTLVEMEPTEQVAAVASVARTENAGKFVWFITKCGLVKKTNLSEYVGTKRKAGVQAINLREGDSIVSVWVGENSDIIILTKEGMGIRFDGATIGATGRTSVGIQGIKLADNDEAAVGFSIQSNGTSNIKDSNGQIFIGCSDGTGKRVMVNEFTKQNRAGKGLKCTHSGKIVTGTSIPSDQSTGSLLLCGNTGSICVSINDITLGSRTSSTVKLIKDNNMISAVKV